MRNKKLFDFLIDEVNEDFEGWDFSHISLTGRMQEFPLRWNYRNEILPMLRSVSSMLDMGTGGGEFLSTLKPLPKFTCATEAYKPNVQVAKNRLEPLGVDVFEVKDDNRLPFDNESFELIINRHESYSAKEINRILKYNGMFITQQVGGLNDKEINELLQAPQNEYFNWNLEKAVFQLENTGLKVLKQKEDLTKTRFYDVGAIVYYLKAIPWQVPDFTVEKYYDKLASIHDIIEEKGYIDFTCHRFLIIALKE